jgi:hypothetical protein
MDCLRSSRRLGIVILGFPIGNFCFGWTVFGLLLSPSSIRARAGMENGIGGGWASRVMDLIEAYSAQMFRLGIFLFAGFVLVGFWLHRESVREE